MPQQKKEFKTHNAEYGKFGGGTQPPVYFDKDGNEKPFNKTKWAELAGIKKLVKRFSGKGGKS